MAPFEAQAPFEVMPAKADQRYGQSIGMRPYHCPTRCVTRTQCADKRRKRWIKVMSHDIVRAPVRIFVRHAR